jgi:hypothetical protein
MEVRKMAASIISIVASLISVMVAIAPQLILDAPCAVKDSKSRRKQDKLWQEYLKMKMLQDHLAAEAARAMLHEAMKAARHPHSRDEYHRER